MSANTTKLQSSAVCAPSGFRISVWFLLALGLLMFRSGGLAVYAVMAAAVHEVAHIIAVYAVGCRMKYAELNAGGICLSLRGAPSLFRTALILCAGCAANTLAAAVGAYFLGRSFSLGLLIFSGANAVLCLLNILPHSSLDGGKLLRLALSGSPRCERITFWADTAVLFVMLTAGIMLFLFGGKNLTALLLSVCMLAKLPVFGKKKH